MNNWLEWQNFAFKIVFILYPTQEKTYHGITFQTHSFQAKSIMCFEKMTDFRLCNINENKESCNYLKLLFSNQYFQDDMTVTSKLPARKN